MIEQSNVFMMWEDEDEVLKFYLWKDDVTFLNNDFTTEADFYEWDF